MTFERFKELWDFYMPKDAKFETSEQLKGALLKAANGDFSDFDEIQSKLFSVAGAGSDPKPYPPTYSVPDAHRFEATSDIFCVLLASVSAGRTITDCTGEKFKSPEQLQDYAIHLTDRMAAKLGMKRS